jgi:peptide/nickel transport system permease protein
MALAKPLPVSDVVRQPKTKDVGQTSQFTLMRRRFMQSKLSVIGSIVLLVLYAMAILANFLAPYPDDQQDSNAIYRPPTSLTLANGGLAICGSTQHLDTGTFTWAYTTDCSRAVPVQFFGQGYSYRLFGVIPTDRHLFEVPSGHRIYLLGTDAEGRDMLSRILSGARVSLTIGLVGVAISTLIGGLIGTLSGYFGGAVDNVMQRVIELLLSIPTLTLWMAIGSALPHSMPVVTRYFLITIILATIGWTALGRQVRGKVMGYKGQDYTAAARLAGASHWRIITRHLMPNSMSHIIVTAALAIPAQILGETSLSFLGFGMLPPAVSWGVLLKDAQQVAVVEQHAWLLLPAAMVVLAVTCFLFIGDGLRDAVDPYG